VLDGAARHRLRWRCGHQVIESAAVHGGLAGLVEARLAGQGYDEHERVVVDRETRTSWVNRSRTEVEIALRTRRTELCTGPMMRPRRDRRITSAVSPVMGTVDGSVQ
jgi:hypothetical protein